MLHKGVWMVLAVAQPLNGLLFVADGLMYATQQFRFVRWAGRSIVGSAGRKRHRAAGA